MPTRADPAGPSSLPGPHSPVRSPKDLATGLLFIFIGCLGLWFSREWPLGTLAMMDSGFFPRVLSAFVLLGGVVLSVMAFLTAGEGLPGWALRPLLGVSLAVIAFALTIERLGMVVAILAIVAVSSVAGAPLRPVPFVLLWASLSVLCVGIFIWGVSLPIQVWPF